MNNRLAIGLVLALAPSLAYAKDTQFWNLTAHTITALQLSPAGRDQWGADQTANDPDHSVDHDERLKILGIVAGAYDVKFTDKTGRTCEVKNLAIREGRVFSIDEKQVGACGR